MGRQRVRTISRLRRLGRMLAGDIALADALVDEVLSGRGQRSTDPARLFALLVAAHRLQAGASMRPPITRLPGDLPHAFAALPLAAREALALVVVEELDYAQAASILGTTPGQVIARLEEGRRLLARRLDGERVALRLVQ